MNETTSWLVTIGCLLAGAGLTIICGPKDWRGRPLGSPLMLIGVAIIIAAWVGRHETNITNTQSQTVNVTEANPSSGTVSPVSSVGNAESPRPINTREESPVSIQIYPRILTDFVAGQRPSVKVNYKNLGSAPVHNVTSYVHLAIFPYPLPANHVIPTETLPPNVATGTLEPGVTDLYGIGFAQFDSAFSQEWISTILDGTSYRLYVEGRVSYSQGSKTCSREFLFSTGGTKLAAAMNELQTTGKAGNDFWDFEGNYSERPPACTN